MTISSPDHLPEGGIDLAAFGLTANDLVSLRSLDALWRQALAAHLETARAEPVLLEFLTLAAELPLALAEPAWQQDWVLGWHKLLNHGYAQTDVFHLFFRILAQCEAELLGDSGSVSRLIVNLFTNLRRAVLASVIGVIDLSATLYGAAQELPNELAALRSIRQCLDKGEFCGLLSVYAVSQEAFASLPAGDLQQIPGLLADHIGAHLRSGDQIFTGRDNEWIVLLNKLHSSAQVMLAASQISRVLENPLTLVNRRRVSIQTTIGCAALPEHATDAEEALKAARLARWQAYREKQPYVWYEPNMGERWQQGEDLAPPLHTALILDELELWLQPQIDLTDMRCIDAELLLRWRHNDRFIAPPVIIELIEKNGWRTQYTDWLLRSALRTLSELTHAGIDVGLSINLTAADMLDPDLPELLAQHLATWRLSGKRLTLELTESALLNDRAKGLANMERLRALGCRLALDDFGTGYSSLSYLVTLPVQEIKIDRSFVIAMQKSTDARHIVRTIVDLTNDLGMLPVAEGVENEAAHAAVTALGCQVGQGYLYGKPMPQAEFITWYRSRQ